MNKYIKRKKQIKMYKREFTKEQLLFQKQFPHLFAICDSEITSVSRLHIKRVYNKVMKHSPINKDEFEFSLKIILYRINHDDYSFLKGSRIKYYYDLYTSLGIMFNDNDGNIKLKCI